MAWPWSLLSDNPQHWPQQPSASSPLGENRRQVMLGRREMCTFWRMCSHKHSFVYTLHKLVLSALPQAKIHRDQLFRVQTPAPRPTTSSLHASFSTPDSNRCTLDLLTESLFYPLLTNFISLPPLLCLHPSMPFLFPFFDSFTRPLQRLLFFFVSHLLFLWHERGCRSVFPVVLSERRATSVR